MGTVHGCHIPDDLFYNVENNVWARPQEDGLVVVGMTAYACSLSGTIVSYLPRKVGKEVRQDKSCATVESGKWVGPVKAPVDGEVVEVNTALLDRPERINEDPYGEGWLLKIRPFNWEQDARTLLTGAAALDAYARRMDDEGFGGC